MLTGVLIAVCRSKLSPDNCRSRLYSAKCLSQKACSSGVKLAKKGSCIPDMSLAGCVCCVEVCCANWSSPCTEDTRRYPTFKPTKAPVAPSRNLRLPKTCRIIYIYISSCRLLSNYLPVARGFTYCPWPPTPYHSLLRVSVVGVLLCVAGPTKKREEKKGVFGATLNQTFLASRTSGGRNPPLLVARSARCEWGSSGRRNAMT